MSENIELYDEPDYIVIGAGSAGSVLARRLTEDGSRRVLLVEAGPDERSEAIRSPSRWLTLSGSEYDWGFATEPQKGLLGRRLPYPRGKVVGGSSSINAMVHIRGSEPDFAEWVAGGATNWSYDRLLPFMDKTEHDPEHDDDGGVHLATQIPPSEFAAEVMKAMQSDGSLRDITMHSMAIRDGERESASDGYLTRGVRERANLAIMTGATVTRLVFEQTRCVGIELTTTAGARIVRAEREVILSAGAIGSPHLLMVSGIGRGDHLASFGIPVLIDAPEVGQGLQDHPQGGITFSADSKTPPVGGGLSALATIDEGEFADVQFMLVGTPYHPAIAEGPERGFTVAVGLMKPTSRGSVRLRGADMSSPPVIDPNLLGNRHDANLMAYGLQAARQLIARSDLDRWNVQEVLPGTAVQSHRDLVAFARRTTSTYFHATGTCRLGSDPRSVVDEQLRVRGVTGLRVIDASVMPTLISTNPNPAVYAIAEYGAAMLLEESHVFSGLPVCALTATA